MTPQWVGQRARTDCWIAALAMVTGQTYDAVLAVVAEEPNGADEWVHDSYLVANGYAVARKFQHMAHLQSDRDVWPPEPWADIHLCSVEKSGRGHAVVMLADGTVLDPNGPEPRRLTDYAKVHSVAAVYQVNEKDKPK